MKAILKLARENKTISVITADNEGAVSFTKIWLYLLWMWKEVGYKFGRFRYCYLSINIIIVAVL